MENVCNSHMLLRMLFFTLIVNRKKKPADMIDHTIKSNRKKTAAAWN